MRAEYGSPEFTRARRQSRDWAWLHVVGITIAALVVGALFVIGAIAAVKADNKAAAEFKSRCEAMGGFTVSQSENTSGYVWGVDPSTGKYGHYWQSSSNSWTECRQKNTGYIVMQRGR